MNNIMSEFDRLLGGPLIPIGDHAVISVFPHKEFFVLGMRCGDAVGRLFDLGEAVLFNCHLKYGGYDFEERENRTLYLCNVVNKQLNWIKLILNERYELELRAYVVVDKDDWYNSVLGYIESYVDMAFSVYDNC